jgi:uncharacterized protein
VATLPSLQGYTIEDYGYRLGRAWGIGQAQEDDGAIFITAPAERDVRIEVGYGLGGRLTDLMSGVILRQHVLPRFRAGEMEAGVVAGTDALIQHLSLPADAARARVAQAETQAPRAAEEGGGSIIGLVITLLVLWFILSAIFGGRGRRRRRRGGGVAGDVAQVVLWSMLNSGGGGRGGGWGGGGGGFGGGGFRGGGGSSGAVALRGAGDVGYGGAGPR